MKTHLTNFIKYIAVVCCLMMVLYSPNIWAQCTIDNTCAGTYANVVICEVSGDSGQSDGCEDAIVEICGPPGAMIGCMVISNTEWAVLIPPNTVIPADGVYMIGCSASTNENCGVGNPDQSGLIGSASAGACEGGGNEGDFNIGLLPEIDFDTCDPANASFYDPAATGFTLDNPGGNGNGDGDQVFLFLPDGTPWDGIVWDGGGTGTADHVSVSTNNVPYTLGDNDGNGVINDNAGTVGGGRGDGGNSTAVPILPTDAACPCNTPTDPGTFTVPPISDPIWFDNGDNDHAGCNSSFIRGPLAGAGVNGTPSHTDGLITSTTLDASGQPIDNGGGVATGTTGDAFTPEAYTPSSCGDATAEWGYTDHPTPGQPNNDPAFVFYADVTSVCNLTDPVTLCTEIYNYQNVSDGSIDSGLGTSSGCDNINTGSLVDFNGVVQNYDTYTVSGETTTMCVTLSTWNPGVNTVGLVWDDWSNTNGTTGNPATQGNPNECYERFVFEILAAEPLVATQLTIDCEAGDSPAGAVDVSQFITGGADLTYELFDISGGSPGTSIAGPQSTSTFLLNTSATMGDYEVVVTDGSGCSAPVTLTILDNCEEPPVCPEDFVTTVDGGAGPVTACPGATVNLCFDGNQLPSGGSVTWQYSSDGATTFTDIESFPIPAPVGCAATTATSVTGLTPFAGGANAGWELDAAGNWVSVVDYTGIGTTSGNGTGVHFTQIVYDPGTVPAGCGDGTSWSSTGAEIVEISGPPGTDIGCYIFSDGEAAIVIPPGTTIPADGVFVIGSTCAGAGYPTGDIDLVVTSDILQGSMIFGNSGDQVILVDPTGTLVDGLAYEGADAFGNVPATTEIEGSGGYNSTPTNMEFCTMFTIPDDACPTATYDFQAVVDPFDAANCPVDGPDELDPISEPLQVTVSCPNAILTPAVFDVCEADANTVNVPVTITGGAGPFTLTYNDGTMDVTLNAFASGDMIPIVGPTDGEIKVTLVSIVDEGGALCAGSVGTDEVCVNIRPTLDLTITSSTSPTVCTPCDGTVTFDLSTGTSVNAFDIDYTLDGVPGSVSSVSMPYTLTGVCPGAFDITGAIDDSGCPMTVTSNAQTLTSPAAAPLSVDAQPAAICGDGTASIDLSTDATYTPAFTTADFQIFDVDPNTLPQSALSNTPSPLIYSATDASTSTVVSGITAATTYYVQYTDPVTGCTSVAPVNITIDNSLCAACAITAATLTPGACSDPGTPDDPTDDTFTFTISDVTQSDATFVNGFTFDGIPLGLTATEAGTYGAGVQYTSGAINITNTTASSPYTITLADADDPLCTFDVILTVPATCSNCTEVVVDATTQCAADGTYEIVINSITGGDATGGTDFTVTDGTNTITYPATTTITGLSYTGTTSQPIVTLTITDADNTGCTTTYNVFELNCVEQTTCDCSMTDPFSISVQASGNANGYQMVYVLADASGNIVGVANQTGAFGPLPDDGAMYTVHAFNVADADVAAFIAEFVDGMPIAPAGTGDPISGNSGNFLNYCYVEMNTTFTENCECCNPDAGAQASLSCPSLCVDPTTGLSSVGDLVNVAIDFTDPATSPAANYGYAFVITDATLDIVDVAVSANYTAATPADFNEDVAIDGLAPGDYCIHGLSYNPADLADPTTLIGMNAATVAPTLTENDGAAAAGATCADLNVAACTPFTILEPITFEAVAICDVIIDANVDADLATAEYYIQVTNVLGGTGNYTIDVGGLTTASALGADIYGPFTYSGTGTSTTTVMVTDDNSADASGACTDCTATADVLETLCVNPICDCTNDPNAGAVLGQADPGTFNTDGYTQIYVLVDNATGNIIEFNNNGFFDALANGNYDVYAINVEDADLATLTGGLTANTPIADFDMDGEFMGLCYTISAAAPFTVNCICCDISGILVTPTCNPDGSYCVDVSFTATGGGASGYNIVVDGITFGSFPYVAGATQTQTGLCDASFLGLSNTGIGITVTDIDNSATCTDSNTFTEPNCFGPSIMIDKDDPTPVPGDPADADGVDDQQTVVSGNDATFTITITNNGNEPLCSIVLTDIATDGGLNVATCQPSFASIDTDNGAVAAGSGDGELGVGESETFTCTVMNVTADFMNTIEVDAEGCTTGTTVEDDDPTNVIVVDPEIDIIKDDSTPGDPDTDGDDIQVIPSGGTATFTIIVTNTGTEDLCDVVLTDIPSDPSLGVVTCQPSFASIDTDNGTLLPGLGDGILAVGDVETFTCTVTGATASFTNTIEVDAEGCTTGTVVEDDDPTDVVIVAPDITIDKDDADNTDDIQGVPIGGTATFTITITNSGSEDLCNVVLTDIATDGTLNVSMCEPTFASIDTDNGTVAAGSGDGILAVGDVETYTCTVMNVTADFTNNIEVDAEGCDTGTTVEDDDPTDVVTETFDLALTKMLASAGPFAPGDDVDFDIEVCNQGTIDATDVEVTDYVPTPDLIFNAGDNPIWTGGTATAPTTTIASIPAGTCETVTITLQIDPSIIGSLTIINNAEITAAEDDMGNPATDEDSTPNDNSGTPPELDTDNDTDDEGPGTPGTGDNPDDEDDFDPAPIVVNPPPCPAESGNLSVIFNCPDDDTECTVTAYNSTVGFETWIAITDATGIVVAVYGPVDANGQVMIPYSDWETLGVGEDYLLYAYNYETATPPTAYPTPNDLIGNNISSIINPLDGCSDISTTGTPLYMPAPLISDCNNQIDEGNEGGITPIYYNRHEMCIKGGTPPYSFDWCTQGYVRHATSGAIDYGDGVYGMEMDVIYSDNAVWAVTITDDNGCTSDDWVFTNDPVVEAWQQSGASIAPGSTGSVLDAFYDQIIPAGDCYDLNDGSISICLEGGYSGEYTYSWTGPFTWTEGPMLDIDPINDPGSIPASANVSIQNANDFFGGQPPITDPSHCYPGDAQAAVGSMNCFTLSGLTQGWYTVTVTDQGTGTTTPSDDPNTAPNSTDVQETVQWFWVHCNFPYTNPDGTGGIGRGKTTQFDQGIGLIATPNPFTNSTEIVFSTANTTRATINIFNVTGKQVANLFDATMEANKSYELTFDGSKLPAGVYVVELTTEQGITIHEKLLLVK